MIDGVKALIAAEKAEPEPIPNKFYYFPLMGRGEALRMLMHHAGEEFEDIGIPQDKWPEVKPTMPGGSMPVLEFPDGTRMGQTCSLLRYLGKKNGYYPKDPEVAVWCDILCEDYNDRIGGILGPFLSPPEAQKAAFEELFTKTLPPWLDRLEKLCSKGNKFLFGNDLCTADFFVGSLYTNYFANPAVG